MGKKLPFILIFLLTDICIFGNITTRRIDNPICVYDGLADYNVKLLAAEIEDSTITLHFNLKKSKWFDHSFNDATHIIAAEDTFYLKKAIGFEIGKPIVIANSGDTTISMMFDLPTDNISFIDFYISSSQDIQANGIDLTGNIDLTQQADGVPDRLKHFDVDNSLPKPRFGNDSVTFNVIMLNWQKGYPGYISFNCRQYNKIPNLTLDDKGRGSMRYEAFHDGSFEISYGLRSNIGNICAHPGDTVTVYIDALANAKSNLPADKRPRFIWTDSDLNDLNSFLNTDTIVEKLVTDYENDSRLCWRMDNNAVVSAISNSYIKYRNKVDSLQLPKLAREYAIISGAQMLLKNINNYKTSLEGNYRLSHNYDTRGMADSIKCELTDEQLSNLYSLTNINDERLLWGRLSPSFIYKGTLHNDTSETGFYADMTKFMNYKAKASRLQITDKELCRLRASSHPYLADVCAEISDRIASQLPEGVREKLIPTPEVADSAILEAIIASYPGKALIIDFWNAWCGACINHINNIEPLKNDRLKSDEIEWIYIADESSPIDMYYQWIAKISGRHYILTTNQMAALINKYTISYYPTFYTVDKDGNLTLRNDFLNNHERLFEFVDKYKE